MKIAVYGSKCESLEIARLISSSPAYYFQKVDILCWSQYDQFLNDYSSSEVSALLVTADGGEGLEVMTAASVLNSNTPRAWFPDDCNLGPQAVRLGAAYFGRKPLTVETIELALEHCGVNKNFIELV